MVTLNITVFSGSLSWHCGTLYHHSPYFLFCVYSCNLVFCTFMVTLNITVFSGSLSWHCGTLYHHSPYFLFCVYSCNLVFCTFMVTLNITVCSLVPSHGSVGLSTIILLISCSVFTPVILYFVHSWLL